MTYKVKQFIYHLIGSIVLGGMLALIMIANFVEYGL